MPVPRLERMLPTQAQAYRLSAAGFGREWPELPDITERLLDQCDFGVVSYPPDSSEPSGFGLFRRRQFAHRSLLFASAVIVDPEYQGQGTGKRILHHGLRITNCGYLALNTASPHMYTAARKLVDTLYPTLDQQPLPTNIANLAASLTAQEPYQGMLVRRGWFNGQPPYAAQPQHDNAQAFYNLFDYAHGDAVLCIGRVAGHSMGHTVY